MFTIALGYAYNFFCGEFVVYFVLLPQKGKFSRNRYVYHIKIFISKLKCYFDRKLGKYKNKWYCWKDEDLN